MDAFLSSEGVLALVTLTNGGGVATSAAGRAIGVRAPFVDLAGALAAGAPSSLVRGQRFSAGVVVLNAGNVDFAAPVGVSLFASTTASI